ncbi:C-type mannose receptor 2-like isoform X1 [Xyrauchen texanus]|uniref:C-type mannose receptor 2-like isoform X1 n=1 Tax=Xyrauchen texanus TaxID=154827 RepID=UPI002242BDB1|nr:C-type mannose receptor 2-like isoform X1 [Xyrauchen texanus]XP_051986650.1 C-type mannose receptor 2-like isoform X1 [Xyrauchen texanus]
MEQKTFITFILSAVFSSSACVPRQYHFVNQNLNWTEAQRYCRENYTDLATINNKNDIEDLLKSVNDGQIQHVWIGLQKTVSYKWKWSLGDPAFYTENNSQYRNWAPTQPNDNVDCSNMNPGQWNDFPCDNNLPFICYNDSSKGFIPVQQTMTWRAAQNYCREHHTDLVSVRNQTENEQIEKIRNDTHTTSGVWIGLFRDSWEWSDQSNSSFRNWRKNIPDNVGGNENCAVLWVKSDRGQWGDWSCDKKTQFVCHEDKLVLIQQNLSWNEALRYCRENHVDLVSVQSEQIQRRVMNVARKASTAEVWLGLRHSCTMGIWFWVNGEILCYQNWAAGNGTGVENCSDAVRVGAVQSGGDQRWISLPQTHKLNFICTNYDE